MSWRMEGQALRESFFWERIELIEKLGHWMRNKLEVNKHKGHWGNEDPRWLLQRAKQEIEELEAALAKWEESPTAEHACAVWTEAADIANFAAMAACNVSSRTQKSEMT